MSASFLDKEEPLNTYLPPGSNHSRDLASSNGKFSGSFGRPKVPYVFFFSQANPPARLFCPGRRAGVSWEMPEIISRP